MISRRKSKRKRKSQSPSKDDTSNTSISLLRSEVAALHAEMEIADYGINEITGRSRRKPTRKDQKERTIKRKSLEKEDVKDSAVKTSATKRLRGSKAAFGDEIVHGSLIFGSDGSSREKKATSEKGDDVDDFNDEEFIYDGNSSNSDELDEDGRYELLRHEDMSEDGEFYNHDEENSADQSEDEAQELDDNDDDNDDDEPNHIEGIDQNSNPAQSSTAKKCEQHSPKNTTQLDPTMLQKIKDAKRRFPQKKIARTMYRLRNFSSHRMAEKHGDALGRHARGLNRSAVAKLKEVASAAPIAPQVYSSLGLVYESMLADELKKCEPLHEEQLLTDGNEKNGETKEENHVEDKDAEDKSNEDKEMALLQEAKVTNSCIDLAEKTFGSYHVAALLCKLDYTLWLRAGDSAMKLADLHKKCLSLPPVLDGIKNDESVSVAVNTNIDVGDEGKKCDEEEEEGEVGDNHNSKELKKILTPEEYTQHHRARRMKWLEEAKNDYLAADHIHPPGISVPCKLACAHIQLGNLSEALTILTDMKNNSMKSTASDKSGDGLKPRSELERSYSAWLLYADLMLTVGFECSKWNRGVKSNSNYMFRRWLRKYSTTFDWKERRLQALYLAFEAAVGTKCCENVISYIQRRAYSLQTTNDTYGVEDQTQKSTEDANDIDNEEGNVTRDILVIQTSSKDNLRPTTELSLDELTKTFNAERAKLLSQNRRDLEQFDKKSEEMGLNLGGATATERAQEREALIKKQKDHILNLAGQYRVQKNQIESLMQSEVDKISKIQPLPISASCSSVFDIASQLMKLCLGMELYSLGVLVARAISVYLQERTLRSEARKSNMRAFNQRQIAVSSNILQLSKELYDDLHENTYKEPNDGDSVDYLSDDDHFDHNENQIFFDALKKGVLPPELQVLHGTCLIGEGGSDFLAEQLIKSMKFLDEDGPDEKSHFLDIDHTINDMAFEIFRGAMLDTLNKSSGFAFFTDFVLKTKKDVEWAERLLPIYEEYIGEIEGGQEVSILHMKPSSLPTQMLRKRNCYVKVLLFMLQLKLNRANELKSKDGSEKACNLANVVICTIRQYSTTLLPEINRRELSDESTKTLKLMAASYRIILDNIEGKSDNNEDLLELHSSLRFIVSWICRVILPNHEDNGNLPQANVPQWSNFPFSSEWQTEALHVLSKRSLNLGASCNVSCFSGWENDEFDLKLIRRDEGPSYFGVHLNERQVVGQLNSEKEILLASQWKMLSKLAPELPDLNFESTLKCVKHEDWYRHAMLDFESKFRNTSIARYAEEEALDIILMYSKLSLKLATIEYDTEKKHCLLAVAMSIILPLSQFCLDRQLWDSDIGRNAVQTDTVSEWKHFAQTSDATEAPKPQRKQNQASAKKTSYPSKRSQCNLVEHKNSRLISPLMQLVKVPVEVLLREWNGDDMNSDDEDREYVNKSLNKWTGNASGPATIAMKRVDFCLMRLRKCSSVTALQRSSLQVARALLDLVSTKDCQNPFLCLQHAATFSSQGCKGGNNDEEFKKPLPEESECTPNQAISIIGRADCLRAIHFTDEALFICSYVARVCRLHRDKKSDLEWNSKWRVVAILMYTISVAIDATIYSLMEGESRSTALQSWGSDIKAEISRARSDAQALQKSFAGKTFNGKKKAFSTSIATSRQNENKDVEEEIIDDEQSYTSNDDYYDDDLQYENYEEYESDMEPEDFQEETNYANDDINSESIMMSSEPSGFYETKPESLQLPLEGLNQINMINNENIFVEEDMDEKIDEVSVIAI